MAEPYDLLISRSWGTYCNTATRPMGMGILASPTLVFKRQFRWTMAIQYCIATGNNNDIKTVPEEFVKMSARPAYDIEETQVDYLNGRMWIPGKATPQQTNVTYYDVGGTLTVNDLTTNAFTSCLPAWYNNTSGAGCTNAALPRLTDVWGWLASVYDITDPCNLFMGSRQGDYAGQALIRLYDGCGATLEAWLLSNIFPVTVNFGELSMESSEICTIELTLRWSQMQWRSLCPSGTITKCPCTPCT